MSTRERKSKRPGFHLALKGAYPEGNGGGHIDVVKWDDSWGTGFGIELEGGHRAGVVTDRESLVALRDGLTALLDATAEDEANGGS
ncbi:hypothetical protein O152_gp193 [Pseudomonas phage PaBG]|uniref:hypothetical protein n=1 Tax=Pseudomonas phage PaBG TaxID=1335230 RepID=UPI00155E13C0|nr:hypothetical protein O152_gp193 [Pseudomonas phage PaBG]QKE11226.1 hypothetical protein PaBG_00293 [Pseudomonas phage PaBG]